MDTLKNTLQGVKPNFTEKECDEIFPEIAKLLLENYAIENYGKIYRFTDIEFYYYNDKINDERENNKNKKITYERTTHAGCWFFHNSGLDISFESDKDKGFGGGILIRGIQQIEPKLEKPVFGSLNSYWELFIDYVDAFAEKVDNPHIIRRSFELKSDEMILSSERHGLEKIDINHRKWRFYIVNK